MPKIYLNQDNKYEEITQFIGSYTWSGGKTEAARKLEINLLNSVLDKNVPSLYIKNGSILKLFNDDGELLFKGFVFFNERSGTSNMVQVTAYDHLVYLLKSTGTYNFKKQTAEHIVSKLCADMQVPVGKLAATGISQSFIANSKSFYDIMMQAYTTASQQNGKKYMPRIKEGKLDVIEVGSFMTDFMLDDESNIIDSGYSESIEKMINRVKIYDDKGNLTGTVENADWIKKYGILQDTYTKQKDKNAQSVAKEMLTDVEKTASIEALGNVNCITGNAIQVKDSNSTLKGVFYIDSDSHTWSNGQHIMRLKLNFKNVMDEKKGVE